MPPAVNASEIAMYSMVFLPVSTRGSRRISVLLLTASMPVNDAPPSENARRKMTATANPPSCDTAVCVSRSVSPARCWKLAVWEKMPALMSTRWLIRKLAKIGVRIRIDSLTPRTFMAVSNATTRNSASSLNGRTPGGRKEKIASQPEATEVTIVST